MAHSFEDRTEYPTDSWMTGPVPIEIRRGRGGFSLMMQRLLSGKRNLFVSTASYCCASLVTSDVVSPHARTVGIKLLIMPLLPLESLRLPYC